MSIKNEYPNIRISHRARARILRATHDHCSVKLSMVASVGDFPKLSIAFIGPTAEQRLGSPPIYFTDFFSNGVDEAFNLLASKGQLTFSPAVVDENYIQNIEAELNRLVLATATLIAACPRVHPSVAVTAKRVYLPGDTIEIKVGGRPFKTHIDAQGTQRFVANSAIRALVDGLHAVFDNTWMKRLPFPPGYKGLNELAVDYQMGKITLNDYIDFHAMMGYSVCGFADIFNSSHAPIENPVWD